MADYSYVFNAHPSFIDTMYLKYQDSPDSVDDGWRSFFEGFDFAGQNGASTNGKASLSSTKEFGLLALIDGFRHRGHLLSTTNPIRDRRNRRPHLDLADYNLEKDDLGKKFQTSAEIGLSGATAQETIDKLHKIYAGNIGFEYAHIANREKRMWLRDRIENRPLQDNYGLPIEKKKRILDKLNGAVIFEKFLHTKYIGQKRFSLEGGETMIAGLDAIIQKSAEDIVEEVLIGMAHRGRLNVLANIMGKTYEKIFNEFEGAAVPDQSFGDGDVKYHLGFSSQITTPQGKTIHLKLAPNPSHLESVNPVLEGFARAKADVLYDSDYDKILPILIHGDAAIAGQGVVYETVQMSQLDGYYTGGTIHLVINNQVGFTTNFDDARSSTYCTGVASLVEAPVFHVNGDDPDAMVFAVELATEYRQKFNNDVFIDMVCYRKHGHNEGDDPKFTQPEMYKFITDHKNPRELYIEKLLSQGAIEQKLAKDMEDTFWQDLQQRLDDVKMNPLPYEYQEPEIAWRKLTKHAKDEDFRESPKTGISKAKVSKILKHLQSIPDGFTPLSKVKRLFKNMDKLLSDNKIDWALGELMAYASIMMDGNDVRMSGQDVKRGTFSHRHAILNDIKTFDEYNRLNTLEDADGIFRIFNSLLSEFAVLGFEYGYSLANPNTLVLWEAQFGDFYNGAQTIVDQYISAAESKWQRMSGLVMLLPHGYEGQGPEHSSARIERFLQSCAENNMQIANISTPANMFHALRRQLARPFRKPLIIFTPKSLLRHPECVSDVSECYTGAAFQEVITQDNVKDKKVERILYCTGKIYYDLLARQAEQRADDAVVSIVRIEQLYPFPEHQLQPILDAHAAKSQYWVQEESANMGCWDFLMRYWRRTDIQLISRKASASPATGFKQLHDEQQQRIIDDAFAR